jgi:hypothetical protein
VKKNLHALIAEKLNKLLDQLNLSRISGIRPYRISGAPLFLRLWRRSADLLNQILYFKKIKTIPVLNGDRFGEDSTVSAF